MVKYFLYGIKRVQRDFPLDSLDSDCMRTVHYLNKLCQLKSSTFGDEEEAASLVTDHCFPIHVVPTEVWKQEDVSIRPIMAFSNLLSCVFRPRIRSSGL